MITNRSDEIENDNPAIPSCPCNDKKYYVYILESSDKAATYVGATINLDHRLRRTIKSWRAARMQQA